MRDWEREWAEEQCAAMRLAASVAVRLSEDGECVIMVSRDGVLLSDLSPATALGKPEREGRYRVGGGNYRQWTVDGVRVRQPIPEAVPA